MLRWADETDLSGLSVIIRVLTRGRWGGSQRRRCDSERGEREREGQRREIGKCYASGLKEEEGATSQGILVALENLNKAREDTLS